MAGILNIQLYYWNHYYFVDNSEIIFFYLGFKKEYSSPLNFAGLLFAYSDQAYQILEGLILQIF